MPTASAELLKLPVLQETYNGTDTMKTIDYVVDRHFTKKKMKELLKVYHLSCSGTREDMLERLRDYAMDPTRWAENYQATPTRVRGTMKGSRAKSILAKRMRAQFGSDDDAVEHPCKRAVGRPDSRTEADIAQQRELAMGFLAHARTVTAAAAAAASVQDAHRADPLSDDSLLALGLPPRERVPNGASIARLEQRMDTMQQSLYVIQTLLSSNTSGTAAADVPVNIALEAFDFAPPTPIVAPTAHQFLPDRTPFGQPTAHSVTDGSRSTDGRADGVPVNVSESTGAAPDQTNTLSDMRSTVRQLQFDDVVLTFDATSVPDIPVGLSYAGNQLDELFTDWYQSAHLTIDGHPIALRHWPRVYQCRAGFKKHAWPKYRSTWHNWKYLVEEFEALGSSKEAFWSKYRDAQGEKMTYYKILDALKAVRKTASLDDGPNADEARRFFGGDLLDPRAGGRFTYRGRQGVKVCTSDKEVAKRWRQLLEEDEELRAQWEEWKTSPDVAAA
ncbi:hypothetical protein EIP86_007666 [Pleurotus ostreatoroseus]|nr:hypothetical protein EIP86_007666 [Pleurotus ostreatoroseus]